MPIELFTGLPGHGKTARMLERLLEETKKKDARPIWAGGIDGLKPGYAQILKDPREWNAVKPGHVCTCHDTENSSACDAHVIPNGSLIFIDEAWKWFGHLQDATRQPAPPHVFMLAEHRHRGIDFVWTTQMPSQLYPFARALVADHHHVVRRFGTQLQDVFSWAELNDDVKSVTKRDAALRKTGPLPSQVFDLYKSAELHTIKRKIPWRVLLVPVCVIGAVVCLWVAYSHVKASHLKESLGEKATAAQAAAPSPGNESGERPKRPMTSAEYAARLLPRFGTMPETAPIYDDRPATTAPEVYCMASEAGETATGHAPASVVCLTEQGTVYQLAEADARRLARYGRPYNAFRPQRVEQAEQAQPQAQPQAVGSSYRPQALGIGRPDPAEVFYGGMRGEVGKAPEPQGISF